MEELDVCRIELEGVEHLGNIGRLEEAGSFAALQEVLDLLVLKSVGFVGHSVEDARRIDDRRSAEVPDALPPNPTNL
ncbi:MAG TPA: hypothetical protein VFG61_05255, partial [Gaiellaceae bacterium]|nr:hypothetical protein [Gaiellaceae bacterium]